ncbi:MAG: hypothetical protein H6818_19295 [Phycisphaerales bacterium]|nr:hypothetical protein [Phycisphaerales bacterium]MCB9863613.1 hypothetical protein [Phycisphaerales bacterium]
MTPEDEVEFLSFVRTTGDVRIIAQTSEAPNGNRFSTFQELQGRRLGSDCELWNASISPHPEIKHVPSRGIYCLDFLQSEVINVSPSFLVDRRLTQGRLHVETTVLTAERKVAQKGTKFLKWYEQLSRWIRRHYTGRHDGDCVSARAEALVKRGVDLGGFR